MEYSQILRTSIHHRLWGAAVVILLVFPAVCVSQRHLEVISPDFRIHYADGRLSLQVRNVPLKRVLDKVSDFSGIRFRYDGSVSSPVTLSFDDLPLDKAIKRLVSNNGMVYIKGSQPDTFYLVEVSVANGSRRRQSVEEGPPDFFPDPPALVVPPDHTIQAQGASVCLESAGGGRAVSHELIIRFQKGLCESRIKTFLGDIGATLKKRIRPLDAAVVELAPDIPVNEALKQCSEYGFVAHAEPNVIHHLQTLPNDPFFAFQWGLYNTGIIGGSPFHDIDACNAWHIERGNGQTTIAIVDTGIDYHHPDLAPNIWRNPHEIPGNGMDDDGNGYIDDILGWDFVDASIPVTGEDTAVADNDPMDRHGHGTLVAGVIGASGNNRMGVSGVAWHCRLMPVRAGYRLPTGEGIIPSAEAAEAILYAAKNGAHIINLSWSSAQHSDLIENAIGYATNIGVLVCAAAGNQNTDIPQFPGAIDNPGILTVGASDFMDQRASFSNFGNWVEVFAPGVTIYSTYLSKWYGISGGTSLAVALASGTAGLIKSENPDLNHLQIKDAILNTVDMVPALAGLSAASGRINARKALEAVRTVSVQMMSNESSR